MQSILDDRIKKHADVYMELLSTGKDVSIDLMVPSFLEMDSILHHSAGIPKIDVSALSYAIPRLPEDIFTCSKVILVQSYDDIKTLGFSFDAWTKVNAPARRRLTYIDITRDKMACILSSESDIHDLVNCLISYHIESKKVKRFLGPNYLQFVNSEDPSYLGITPQEWHQLKIVLGNNWKDHIAKMCQNEAMTLRMYGNPDPKYQVNSQRWLDHLFKTSMVWGFTDSPIYFVSSNSHSLVNVIGGFVNQKQTLFFDYLSHMNDALYQEWLTVKAENNISVVNDFLYYVAAKVLKQHPEILNEKINYERELGIVTVKSDAAFQADTQIIPVKAIAKSSHLDSAISVPDRNILAESNALIVNIEYPLGYAAYYLLNDIIKNFQKLRAVYVMGKAAILSGNVGDIQIPTTIYDEKFNNYYTVFNIFNQLFKYQTNISNVFFDQKESCVFGTYLENPDQINKYVAESVNILEMENGAYLKSLAENLILNSPVSPNSSYDLTKLPLEVGIINYASDNPLVQNLAQEKPTVLGIESVYWASIAVVQRIVDLEIKRLTPSENSGLQPPSPAV